MFVHHGHEAETAARARVWITHDLDFANWAELFKVVPQISLPQRVVKTTNEDSVAQVTRGSPALLLSPLPFLVHLISAEASRSSLLHNTGLVTLSRSLSGSDLSPRLFKLTRPASTSLLLKERVGWLGPIALSDLNIAALNDMGHTRLQEPLLQNLHCARRVLFESNESKASTLARVLVAHDGYVNHVPVLRKVPLNVSLYTL